MHHLKLGGVWRLWELDELGAELGEPMFRGPMSESQNEATSVTVVRWDCSTPADVKPCNAFTANIIGGEPERWVLMMPCDRHSQLAQAEPT